MFAQLTLRARLTIVVAVALAGMLFLIVISAINARNELLEGHKALVRSGVQAITNQIAYFQSLEASGKLSRDEAQARAKEAVRTARYGGADGKTDYYYVWTMDGVSVMHPVKLEWAGQNKLETLKDGNGVALLKDMTGALRSADEAFVQTNFPRPGGKDPVPKLQFVKRFDAWNWMIGTGIYTDDVDAAFRSNLIDQLLLAMIPLGLVTLVCVLANKSVLRQLGAEPAYTVEVVQRIAAGHLNTPVQIAAGDRDSLLARVGEMQTQLRELIGQIRQSADSIGEMAETVSQRSGEVSEGSVSQSDAAAAMAAAITQMTESIHQIADSADRANQLSVESGQLSREGSGVIASAVDEMNRISQAVHHTSLVIDALADKTQTITSIVNVIHDVADQTNLLALNAAIEAARAGEQGRGFAVVADEVRKLAERTSAATKEITGMIADIQQSSAESKENMHAAVQRVESGVQLAGQGGEAVKRIEESAGRVVGVVEDISVALKEQTHANNLVSQQVDRISASADSNASAARTAAEVTSRMHSLTEQLRAAVGRFHT